MTEIPSHIPAAWYQDPTDAHRYRWWDGASWTEHVRDPDPSPALIPPAVPEYRPFTPENSITPLPPVVVNTVWVWLIALSPAWVGAVGLIASAALAAGRYSASGIPTNDVDADRLIYALVGLAEVILLVVFAGRDRAELLRSGHPTAASTWWMLLFAPIAYLIARRVKVKRWTGRGAAPGNVFALLYLVPLLGLVVAAVVLTVTSGG